MIVVPRCEFPISCQWNLDSGFLYQDRDYYGHHAINELFFERTRMTLTVKKLVHLRCSFSFLQTDFLRKQ